MLIVSAKAVYTTAFGIPQAKCFLGLDNTGDTAFSATKTAPDNIWVRVSKAAPRIFSRET
jgi:hypothetical protein